MSYDKIMGLRGCATLVCDNLSPDHCGERTSMSTSFESIPSPAVFKNQACDATAELLRLARKAGWLVDVESGRVLCPRCRRGGDVD